MSDNKTTLSEDEIAAAREQLRAGSEAAAEAAKRAGVKRHPRISQTTRRSWPLDEECCVGMDVPTEPWTAEDVAFWTGTERYQPWKDVAAFFRETTNV